MSPRPKPRLRVTSGAGGTAWVCWTHPRQGWGAHARIADTPRRAYGLWLEAWTVNAIQRSMISDPALLERLPAP